MTTIFYPYQLQFVIATLIKYGDIYEDCEISTWHTLASAAACLESLLHGNEPADIDAVSKRLTEFDTSLLGKSRRDATLATALMLATTIITGHRLGLIVIQPVHPLPPRPSRRPIRWIGLDMGTGDRTVYADGRLQGELNDDVQLLGNPAHQLAEQHLGQLLANPQQNLTHHLAPLDQIKESSVRAATSDARQYDQRCSEVRHA